MLNRQEFQQKVGRNLKQIREASKLTQEELTTMTGLSRTYLTVLENARSAPTLYNIYKIVKALGISFGQLLDPILEMEKGKQKQKL